MKRIEQREIERLEYWQGQLLRASDFSAAQNADDQLRWWHNRALHNAYGVSLGLEVEQQVDRVLVNCGLAYDCEGRELLVPVSVRVPFPIVPPADPGRTPEPRLLVLRYARSAGDRSQASCSLCDAVSRTFEFVWVRLSLFDGRAGVPLAWGSWDGPPHLDPAFEPPRSRRIARPHLGSGITPPGGTVWEAWSEVIPGVAAPPQTLGLQTLIDTSPAGFAKTPVYIAQLQIGARPVAVHPLPPPIWHIHDPKPNSFVFRIWLPSIRVQDEPKLFIPRSKVTDVSDDGKTVHLKSAKGFREGDRVRRVAKAGSSTVTNVSEADATVAIDPPIDGVAADDTLRLESIDSVDRLADAVQGLEFFPGMQLQVDGTDADAGAAVSQKLTVIVTAGGSVKLDPPLIRRLAIGDKLSEVPRIAVVSTQTLDFPLVVENLGWHVCWVGAVCEHGPSMECPNEVCEISAEEVC